MKIKTVHYYKRFSLPHYCSEDIGYDVTLEEWETPESVVKELKERAETQHRVNNPNLYPEHSERGYFESIK